MMFFTTPRQDARVFPTVPGNIIAFLSRMYFLRRPLKQSDAKKKLPLNPSMPIIWQLDAVT